VILVGVIRKWLEIGPQQNNKKKKYILKTIQHKTKIIIWTSFEGRPRDFDLDPITLI